MIKPIYHKEAIQIEVTNVCNRACSNCTRLVGVNESYHMPVEHISEVLDTIKEFPGIIGIMGGEPLMHPEFPEICELIQKKGLTRKAGLWSGFPPKYAHYGKLIAETFDKVLPNDHSEVILHAPILVCSESFDYVDLMRRCWVQNAWSSSVNIQGAYFCEIAAALDLTLETGTQWDPLSDWWRKKPNEYYDQIHALCSKCGVCLNLPARADKDEIYDVDSFWVEKLKENHSYKYKKKKYNIVKAEVCPLNTGINEFRKDPQYLIRPLRAYKIACRITPQGYMRPIYTGE
jgi:hypothetical protein